MELPYDYSTPLTITIQNLKSTLVVRHVCMNVIYDVTDTQNKKKKILS